jgi:hypothetical protein
MAEPILVAQSKEKIFLLPKMANRHGLIAGATGTGKTVTLQTLAEDFSALGVPVFVADVKGDLAGLSQPGANNPKILDRAKELNIDDFTGEACPVVFWDVFGEQGHPVRATVSEMGPLLLGRLLEFTPEQRKQIIDSSVLAGHYEQAIDRESAYGKLQARAGERTQGASAAPVTADQPPAEQPQSSVLAEALGTVTAAFQPTIGPRGGVHDSFATSMAKSAMRAASSQLGWQIARGLLGGILGGSGRKR